MISWLRSLWRPGNRKALACIGTSALLTVYAWHTSAAFDSFADRILVVLGVFVTGHVAQRSKLAQPGATVDEVKP